MIPPEKLPETGAFSKLYIWLNWLRAYMISLTPRQGHGTRVHHATTGTMIEARGGDVVSQESSGLKYRGQWSTFVHYERDDIVHSRGSLGGPESAGTFICLRDHDSGEENYPRELTDEGVDPGESTSNTGRGTWRTLASGAWESLTIKGFPIPVVGGGGVELPPIDLPSYTLLNGGSVQCITGTGLTSEGGGGSTTNIGGGIAAGAASGGAWSASATDLPPGKTAKFIEIPICIGGEAKHMWVLGTVPA